MRIRELLSEDAIVPDMTARDKKSALTELCGQLAEGRPGLDAGQMVTVLLERERLGSTGIGSGVAIPHGKLPEVEGLITGFGRSQEGVDFASMDDQPAHLFFVLFAPATATRAHLDALARISQLLQNAEVRARLMAAEGAAGILSAIDAAEAELG
jgi:nitrogen PTS system EIIA component